MADLDLGRVVGKDAYELAVDGGYTGTRDEYEAIMANVASKEYVDNAINGAMEDSY